MSYSFKVTNKQWLVIVNPNSGKRKSEKDWVIIHDLLKANNFTFKSMFTKYRGHATEITIQMLKAGYKNIIVIGGDGTLNEVINGVLSQIETPSKDVKIGIIPIGTGNDLGRMYNIPADYEKSIQIIKEGKSFIQDAGLVSYVKKEKEYSRYFINMAGMGYDALVAKKTNLMKEKGGGGPFAYLINLFLGLIQYQHPYLSIDIDNKNLFQGKAFSLSIGICKFNGGGMMQLPFAVPNNGLFDITLIQKVSKLKVIANIKSLFDGSFVNMPEVETFTGKKINIQSKPAKTAYLETDGESLGHSPFIFTILPKSIQIISGNPDY
ncbi:MAG: diacylglycerol kinase family lipid kinase [Bacteroidetes bacterium]|nr:diacylglycerol kinase family lipid kinase [Bacteroidota bacterium]